MSARGRAPRRPDAEPRRRAPRQTAQRDQDLSPFGSILADLIARAPGTIAAAVVDRDGETVDYAGRLAPFDAKLAAAHIRLILGQLDQSATLSGARLLVVRGERLSFVARPLPDGYALVLIRGRRAFAVSPRPLAVCERALRREAGWDEEDASRQSWFDVGVVLDSRGRPREVESQGAGKLPVTVLGAIVSRGSRERGFRVRITGESVELNLAREAGNFWYVDENIAAMLGAGGPSDPGVSPPAPRSQKKRV